MPFPVTADDFSVVDYSGDLCTQIRQLLNTNDKLRELLAYLVDEAGNPTAQFLIDMEPTGMPVGMVTFCPTSVVPQRWFICNGQAVSRTVYARLFERIGTFYGDGNGIDTFNLPDYQGKFLLGSGGTRSVGDTGGTETHTLTIAEMPSHTHPLPRLNNATSNTGEQYQDSGSGTAHTDGTGTTSATGGDGAHNNMPPFTCGLWLIRW